MWESMTEKAAYDITYEEAELLKLRIGPTQRGIARIGVDAGGIQGLRPQPDGCRKLEGWLECEPVAGFTETVPKLAAEWGEENLITLKGLDPGQDPSMVRIVFGSWQISKGHKILNPSRCCICALDYKWVACGLLGIKLIIDDRLQVHAAFVGRPEIRTAHILLRPRDHEVSAQPSQIRSLIIPPEEIGKYGTDIWQRIVRLEQWTDVPRVVGQILGQMGYKASRFDR